MKVEMEKNFQVSCDGRSVEHWKKGEVHEGPDHVMQGLIRDGIAKESRKRVTKDKGDAANERKTEEENPSE